MGMGLSIARNIVDSHGGRISAENQRGSGAVFRFSLPLAEYRAESTRTNLESDGSSPTSLSQCLLARYYATLPICEASMQRALHEKSGLCSRATARATCWDSS